MAKTLLAIMAGAAIVVAGCTTTVKSELKSGGEEGTASSDPGKAPVSTTDAKSDPPVAELAKCELCGTEVPKAELALHDGKMACKACIEAHGH
jgi:hypothetical protein